MKAIPTEYNGWAFRSRLEARWAVFFDALAIKYEYEKEGYDLATAGYYLPDFWFPHSVSALAEEGWGLWCEIKPVVLTEVEITKAQALCLATKHSVLAIQGSPWPGEYQIKKWSYVGNWGPFLADDERYGHENTVSETFDSGLFQLEVETDELERPVSGVVHIADSLTRIHSYPAVSAHGLDNLDSAFYAVRRARFEHGENPSYYGEINGRRKKDF